MPRDNFCLRTIPAKKNAKGKFLLKENFAKGHVLLREIFCVRTNFAKGKILLRDNFCLRTNFAKGKKLLRENFC